MTHFRFENVLNSISNRSTYDPQTGGTVTMPENINGNWNLFGILGSNTALRNKKYTINTFTMARYNNIVSYMSDAQAENVSDKNKTRQLSLSERLRGTYRNDWWEFSLNGSLAYTHSRNSFKEENNMDTYQFSYGASTNVRLPWNMSIATDISQNSRRGYADASMNRDELIWNAQLSQDFLKGNAATVSIQFYDILRNQSNISRVISAAMRSDTEYNAIYSYCMVHFIYRLNLFGGKVPAENGWSGKRTWIWSWPGTWTSQILRLNIYTAKSISLLRYFLPFPNYSYLLKTSREMDIAVWNSIFLAVIYFLYFAVILTTIFVVILDNRSPVKTMAWILVLFFLPVAGWILYLFFGRSTRKEHLISRKGYARLSKRLWRPIRNSRP